MASIERFESTDGKVRWKARYRTPGGSSRSRRFDRRADAERFLAGIEHNKHLGNYVDPAAGRVSIRDYAERWRAMQAQHRPSTAARVEVTLRRHLYPKLGDRHLNGLLPSDVQAWAMSLTEVLGPATVKLTYSLLVTLYRSAIRDRLVTVSPCIGVRIPAIDRPPVVPLSIEEVFRLADAIADRYRAFVLLAAGTGLRQGEAFGLTIDRIDFLRRTLRVDRQLAWDQNGPRLGPPKTRASYREVPLPRNVVDALAGHVAVYPPGPWDLIFTNESASPVRRTHFHGGPWKTGIARAGLSTGVGTHDLRHFYASLLIREGESVKTVQARLGHASATETLDTYGHLWPDSEDHTRQLLDQAFSRLGGAQATTESTVPL